MNDNLKILFKVFKDVVPALSSGILGVAVLSCGLFGIQTYFSFPEDIYSIGAGVFQTGHLHRLIIYCFYHKTVAQLVTNVTAMLLVCGGVERGVGTIRFLFLFLLMSSITGSIFSLLDLLQDDGYHSNTEGLLPGTLACVSMTTMHTKMSKGFLCGVSFPALALPWVLLMICTALIPGSVLLCNVIGILMGWACGRFSHLGMSESRAALLEKTVPCRMLKRISGVLFIPAAMEERRKTLLPQVNPSPGSYPIQQYAPLSSITTAAPYEGWADLTTSVSGSTPPGGHHGHLGHTFGHIHGHSCNHSHGHGHSHG